VPAEFVSNIFNKYTTCYPQAVPFDQNLSFSIISYNNQKWDNELYFRVSKKSRGVIGGRGSFENLHVLGNVVLRVSDLAIVGTVKNRWT